MNWEPLPQRKPRKRALSSTEQQQAPQSVQEPLQESDETLTADDNTNHQPQAVRAAAIIEANIAARAMVNRSQTTLESQDGCAGEFWEYLDHTADVQCHAWGKDVPEAFEHMATCMLNYMTDIALIEEDPTETITIDITGNDMQSLLYNFMQELLFKFITDCFCAVRAKITKFDRQHFHLNATLYGDIFDQSKHSVGTEIKAITYSNMQIHEKEDRVDLFVIVDI